MAFDPGFLSYRRDPSTGGIFFAKPAGGELLFGGEEAERMAADVDRLRGPDMRMAAYDPTAPFGSTASVPEPAPPPSVPDVPGGMSAAPEAGPAMSAMPQQAAHPPPEPPAQQAPTDGGQPQQVQGQDVTFNAAGYPVGPAGNPFAPAAMLPPQRRQLAATPGGYAPTAKSETVEGAKRYSPELVEGFRNTHDAEHATIAEGLNAQRAIYQAQALQAEAAIPQLEREALDARIKQDIVQRDVAAARQNLEQLSQQASDAKVGGGSIWGDGSGKATAGGVMTLISAALTSMGSAILGRGPTGFDVINGAIERDVAAQRAEVQRKGNKANNALAQYQRQFGDLQTAESALKAVQTRQAATMAQKQAALMGDTVAQQNAMQLAIAADKAYLNHAQQMEEKVQGNSIQKMDLKYNRGSAGGWESDESLAKRQDEWIARQDRAGTYNDKVRRGFAPEKKAEQVIHEGQLAVNLPTGDVGFAPSPARAVEAQKQISAGEQFKRNLQEQRTILEKAGDSITPEERGRYDALVSRNSLLAKDSFALGALTASDDRITSPLTGQGGQDFLAMKAKTLASLKGAEQHVGYKIAEAANDLFKTPTDFSKGNRYVYGNRGAADDPVNVDGAIARPTAEKPTEEPTAEYPNLFGGGR